MPSLLRYCFDLYPPILCLSVCLSQFWGDLWPLLSWRQQGEISSAVSQPLTSFRVSPVLIPMLLLTCIPGEKKKSQILWICLISATKRLLEVSLCWDAYKKVWAWSSKLICCQIELNNFLLLSCLAASSLGGGTSGLELALQDLWGSGCFILCDCGALVWPCQASIPVWVFPLSWNRPGLESTAEIFTPTCSFLSNPWTI